MVVLALLLLQVTTPDCARLMSATTPLTVSEARTLALDCEVPGRERLLHRYRTDLGETRSQESAMVAALAMIRSRAVLDATHAVLEDHRMPTVASLGAIMLLHRYWGGVAIDATRLDRLAAMPRPDCVIPRVTAPFAIDEGLTDPAAITRSVEAIYLLALRAPAKSPLANAPLCATLAGILWVPPAANLTAAEESVVVRLAERAIRDRLDAEPRDSGSWWWRITFPDTTTVPGAWASLRSGLRAHVLARDSIAGDSIAGVISVGRTMKIGRVLLFDVGIGVRYRCGSTWHGDVRDDYYAVARGPDGWPERARSIGGAWSESFGCR